MKRSSELREHARRAGEKLVEDLRFAEVTTGGWANQERAVAEVTRILDSCLDDLSTTDCWGDENRLPSNALWKEAGEILSVGWLQNHARQKPRGYAGDFEMLRKIVDRELCSDPLGRTFDQYFQNQAAPHAVRVRTKIVAERIVDLARQSTKPDLHICSIGSGPAMDIELALEQLEVADRNRLIVSLFDLDPDALAHAQDRLTKLIDPDRLRFHRENLFRLPKLKRASKLLDQADFIACTGLFDYLPNADAIAMLQCFEQQLADSGEMLVFNFAPSNPSRAYMEWIGNWYLMYRDEDDLLSLVKKAGVSDHPFEITREETQASIYLMLRRM